ncbi:MAG: extracellular solute-binding protein, partial [Actinomycetota bacterium]
DRTIRLYTSVSEETVTAVVSAFETDNPGVRVQVFRAPTGDLNARIASEQRSDGVQADVIWASDPLSMQAWDGQGLLLHGWTPDGASEVADSFKTDSFWGTRLLYMVIVHRKGVGPIPSSWRDLAAPEYRDLVEIPDPGFAGSALAMLGYLADEPGYGIDFYRDLKANGARQVASPDDIVTDVAEGRADAGITLEFSGRTAAEAGSPVEVVWPEPGAVSIYSPIGVTASSSEEDAAKSFVESVLSVHGQEVIASTGWAPVRSDVEAPPIPPDAKIVNPDWAKLFSRQSQLLEEYRSIFEA